MNLCDFIHTFVVMSDINECTNDSLNGCNQICTNTIGSFVCECNSGYELGDDLMTCTGLYNTLYIHTYSHTYIHTYIHKYIHTYIHIFTHT